MKIRAFLAPDAWLSPASGPRCIQLHRRLEQGISSGFLGPGTPLPSEREIAALTDLSRVTVRKAIAALVKEDKVVQRQGAGSFIAPPLAPLVQSLSRLTSFSEDMARRDLKSRSQWLERGFFMPSPGAVVTLALGADGSVARLMRLRLADGRPMAIGRAALPVDILPNPTGVERSLYEGLGRTGKRPVRAMQKISAINLTDSDAGLLGVAPRAAGLRIERISYLAGGRVAEFTRPVYRADAYDFVAGLRLSDETSEQETP